jgi:hypothetical protein
MQHGTMDKMEVKEYCEIKESIWDLLVSPQQWVFSGLTTDP